MGHICGTVHFLYIQKLMTQYEQFLGNFSNFLQQLVASKTKKVQFCNDK